MPTTLHQYPNITFRIPSTNMITNDPIPTSQRDHFMDHPHQNLTQLALLRHIDLCQTRDNDSTYTLRGIPMSSPDSIAHYHLMLFASTVEAAGFVAALSRNLNHPQGSVYRLNQQPTEVWCDLSTTGMTVHIYLSNNAYEAAAAAFDPVPLAATVSKEDIPPTSRLIMSNDNIPSWSMEEALQHINAGH